MDGSQIATDDTWTVAGRTFRSRLIIGTGKYKDYALNAAAAEASGAEIVTVALRRVNLSDRSQPMLSDFVKPDRYTYLPNTAGCFSGEEAVRTLRLAREAGGWDLVKLEVLTQTKHLYPDMEETLRALKMLVADGFSVMVYCSDDPVYCRKLEDAGRRGDHAGRRADRLGARHPEPPQHWPDRRAIEGARAGGRRRRHRLGHRGGHGAGLRRGADEHRHRRGQGPDPHGRGDEARGDRRAGGVSGRPHAASGSTPRRLRRCRG